jgi:hypothetical protein
MKGSSSSSKGNDRKFAGIHASLHQNKKQILLLLLFARKMDYNQGDYLRAGVTSDTV